MGGSVRVAQAVLASLGRAGSRGIPCFSTPLPKPGGKEE